MSPDRSRDPLLEDLIGTELGRFRVVERIGAGGMGVVFKAFDGSLKREVALKFLPEHLAGDAERLARFEREAEAVAALNHPSIVTIYSVEEVQGLRFLAMELVEGESLDHHIPPGGLEIDKLFEIAIPLADALVAAHARHIVHRDLKPANIMVTSGGLVKVLDFGLAKLFEPGPEADEGDDATTLLRQGLTREGVIAGSPGYMSPEQVRALTIDHRTDIFSFGLVLYEMATGKKAFSGASWADVQTATLRDDPPSIAEVRGELPRHLGRIVSQCLEKDVNLRLQSAADLRNQLAGLQKELESERILDRATRSGLVPTRPRRHWRPTAWATGALLGIGAIVAALLLLRPAQHAAEAPTPEPPTAASGAAAQHSLAVLPFRNLTGNRDLEWLRSGIAEMMATSLSQAPGLEVLDSRAAYQVLTELEMAGEADWPAEQLRSFAERAEVTHLLHGSFTRLGETYRIDLRVENPATSGVVVATKAEGEGEASLFATIDRLSRGVLDRLDLARKPAAEKERALAQVTTASVEAFRYYAEGVRLRNEIKGQESIPMFEKALEIDPGFAMALSALGTSYLNLGNEELAREYSRRAFENSARAPSRERYFIQGRYLSLDWATYGQAIDAFQRTVSQYPDHRAARNILSNRLASFDDYARAIPHLERLIVENPDYGGNAWLLSTLYAAEGRFDDARSIVSDFQQRNPDNWYGHLLSGLLSLRQGRPDEALIALAAAEGRRPGTNEVLELRWAAFVQADRWSEAEVAARAQAASADPYYQWAGNVYLAISALYKGRSEEALAALAASRRPFERPGALASLSRVWAADLRLLRGEAAAAREEAAAAQRAGRAQWPELNGLFFAGLAAQALGEAEEADSMLAELERRAAAYPNAVETRQVLHLGGLLAAARGETELALERLTRSAALLPPYGLYYLDRYRMHPDHTPIWYALATTLRAAGRDAEAAGWFEQIVERRVESRNEPVRYARSLFHLAEIQDSLGKTREALQLYRRFEELWGDGDLDRELVAKARDRLGS